MSEYVQHREISEEVFLDNRERYRGELAQAIYRLMCDQRVTRSRLAKLLGCHRSRITHMLSGEKDNFQADTIADVFLILGRAAHLTLGVDPTEFRLPIDEASEDTKSSTTNSEIEDTKDARFASEQETEEEKLKEEGDEEGKHEVDRNRFIFPGREGVAWGQDYISPSTRPSVGVV